MAKKVFMIEILMGTGKPSPALEIQFEAFERLRPQRKPLQGKIGEAAAAIGTICNLYSDACSGPDHDAEIDRNLKRFMRLFVELTEERR